MVSSSVVIVNLYNRIFCYSIGRLATQIWMSLLVIFTIFVISFISCVLSAPFFFFLTHSHTGRLSTALHPATMCKCASSWWNLVLQCLLWLTVTCRLQLINVKRWRRATASALSSSMVSESCFMLNVMHTVSLHFHVVASLFFVWQGALLVFYWYIDIFKLHTSKYYMHHLSKRYNTYTKSKTVLMGSWSVIF